MVEARKARAVGFNHVTLDVGEIEKALAFYGRCSISSFAARALGLGQVLWFASKPM
jgi:catechol 2,3-dioxygenase-like lactoylglutathione lyase family enzyme